MRHLFNNIFVWEKIDNERAKKDYEKGLLEPMPDEEYQHIKETLEKKREESSSVSGFRNIVGIIIFGIVLTGILALIVWVTVKSKQALGS